MGLTLSSFENTFVGEPCSNNSCRVAYHPLCARAAGFCAELEDEDRLHLIPVDEDEENQCIRLLSFCKKHRTPSSERLSANERITRTACRFSDYTPPNPSGCARSEPYNYFGRRGRKEPEALAAASLKRLFVENRPYLVGGYCRHELFGSTLSSNTLVGSKIAFSFQKLRTYPLDASKSILSMNEKYKFMRETFRKRLAFASTVSDLTFTFDGVIAIKPLRTLMSKTDEPYNYFGRRGRKEPEALAAASLKRLFVENRPYLVGGYCRHELFGSTLSSNTLVGSKIAFSFQKLRTYPLDASKSILSMNEKYKFMRETFRKRLAFASTVSDLTFTFDGVIAIKPLRTLMSKTDEPYNYFGRRGRKEPEALAAASLKRLFVENRPYLVGGYCRHELFGSTLSSNTLVGSKIAFSFQKLRTYPLDASKSILSMNEKYKFMRETFRKRLAFASTVSDLTFTFDGVIAIKPLRTLMSKTDGKSGIHGFGIFTKHPHRAGDMVIEYTGELVRPSIADRREHLIYNSLVDSEKRENPDHQKSVETDEKGGGIWPKFFLWPPHPQLYPIISTYVKTAVLSFTPNFTFSATAISQPPPLDSEKRENPDHQKSVETDEKGGGIVLIDELVLVLRE
ncbi:unnamed protein product [Ilex paraguariensis]|uniref:PHD-type domain-containing protein n=1 Tax=Ilex paraguariensis TaxID=185542 RepID=A0ABC8TEB1_9AQUA